MKTRDLLLGVFSAAWLAAVGVALVRTGEVSAELWAGLGVGVGAILGLFRNDGGSPPTPPAGPAATTEDAHP